MLLGLLQLTASHTCEVPMLPVKAQVWCVAELSEAYELHLVQADIQTSVTIGGIVIVGSCPQHRPWRIVT